MSKENSTTMSDTTDLRTEMIPVVRGAFATPTGDADVPFEPVILKPDDGAVGAVEIDLPAYDPDLGPAPGRLACKAHADESGRPDAIYIADIGTFRIERESSAPANAPLRNRIAVVTGAAGAIGHGVCKGLLEAGCHVAATDLAGDRLDAMVAEFEQEAPGRILGVAMDVTDEISVAGGFAQVIAAWGGVDIVIVNAGIAMVCSLMELDPEAFRRIERVNIEGTLLTIAEASRILVRQNTGGDIVLISTKNVFAPGARFGAYSATKAASHQLGRIASLEMAEFGVRVNMVAPDAVFSDGDLKSGLWAEVGPDRMKARGLDEEGLEEYYRSRNLLKARVTARHVANAVLFFVTHQTPTTGATIPVDGGLPDSTPR
jgi:NAD(P)-dependent dehydrogenase (short-subunit alcohol dehydrogenase family)